MAMVYVDAGELCERHTEETEVLLEKQGFEMKEVKEVKSEKKKAQGGKHHG